MKSAASNGKSWTVNVRFQQYDGNMVTQLGKTRKAKARIRKFSETQAA